MTSDEIKKALECCSEHEGCHNCLCENECGDLSVVTTEALNYINKLEAEKKEITEKFNCQQKVYSDLHYIIQSHAEEIKTVKSEAFKELAEAIILDYPEMEFYLMKLAEDLAIKER